jgi:hypothetical protein
MNLLPTAACRYGGAIGVDGVADADGVPGIDPAPDADAGFT